jgi:hypothetical protein
MTQPRYERPPSGRDPRGDPTRCGHHGGHRKDGSLCVGPVIRGKNRCRMHLGRSAAVVKEEVAIANIVRQSLNYDGPLIDAGDAMLRTATVAYIRAGILASELDALVEQHGGLHEALIGNTYVVTPDGEKIKTGEHIRGMAQAEAQWWKYAFDFNAQVVKAQIMLGARRDSRVEQYAETLAGQLRNILFDAELALTTEQRSRVATMLRRQPLAT